MTLPTPSLRRNEILRLAMQAKLMLDAGGTCCINDIAGEKELLAFARLLEARLHRGQENPPAGAK